MFCYQCEQAAKGTGCTAHGVCSKDLNMAPLQDGYCLSHARTDVRWGLTGGRQHATAPNG